MGGGVKFPSDAVKIGKRALELGFSTTVGIIHDGQGQAKALGETEMSVYREFKVLAKRSFARFGKFQDRIAQGQSSEWRCRAGARYMYICEDGLVHYCSQQRGYPGVPLLGYSKDDMRREFLTEKGCSPNCTVSCVHMTSLIDFWRAPQTLAQKATTKPELVNIQTGSR